MERFKIRETSEVEKSLKTEVKVDTSIPQDYSRDNNAKEKVDEIDFSKPIDFSRPE